MSAKGWGRWALIASVLLVTPAATCHPHLPPNPPGGGLTSALPSSLRAGVAKVAPSLPAATPLAGYGSATRRQLPPDADPFDGFTFFKPATGQADPLFAKALVMMNDTTKVGIVTVDSVGILSDLVDRIHARAVTLGATIPRENLVVSAPIRTRGQAPRPNSGSGRWRGPTFSTRRCGTSSSTTARRRCSTPSRICRRRNSDPHPACSPV